jgi:hypothetical protein
MILALQYVLFGLLPTCQGELLVSAVIMSNTHDGGLQTTITGRMGSNSMGNFTLRNLDTGEVIPSVYLTGPITRTYKLESHVARFTYKIAEEHINCCCPCENKYQCTESRLHQLCQDKYCLTGLPSASESVEGCAGVPNDIRGFIEASLSLAKYAEKAAAVIVEPSVIYDTYALSLQPTIVTMSYFGQKLDGNPNMIVDLGSESQLVLTHSQEDSMRGYRLVEQRGSPGFRFIRDDVLLERLPNIYGDVPAFNNRNRGILSYTVHRCSHEKMYDVHTTISATELQMEDFLIDKSYVRESEDTVSQGVPEVLPITFHHVLSGRYAIESVSSLGRNKSPETCSCRSIIHEDAAVLKCVFTGTGSFMIKLDGTYLHYSRGEDLSLNVNVPGGTLVAGDTICDFQVTRCNSTRPLTIGFSNSAATSDDDRLTSNFAWFGNAFATSKRFFFAIKYKFSQVIELFKELSYWSRIVLGCLGLVVILLSIFFLYRAVYILCCCGILCNKDRDKYP